METPALISALISVIIFVIVVILLVIIGFFRLVSASQGRRNRMKKRMTATEIQYYDKLFDITSLSEAAEIARAINEI